MDAFEQMGALSHLENFLSANTLHIYGLKPKSGIMVLSNEGEPWTTDDVIDIPGDVISPFGYHKDPKQRRTFSWKLLHNAERKPKARGESSGFFIREYVVEKVASASLQHTNGYTTDMHIVLVEDNAVLAKSINTVLLGEGYTTTCFDNGQTARSWLLDNTPSYDLAILDVLLPDMNGFDICRSLRDAEVKVPILILTSKGAPEDTVRGLDCGADDYLKKPFVFNELLARIRSLLRRQPEIVSSQLSITPDVTLDLAAHKVFKKGMEVHLTAKEFSLLEYFVHHPNTLLTQQHLYDHVFDFAEVQLSNTIEVHIKNLRKKLRTDVALPLITIRNAGYRFDYE